MRLRKSTLTALVLATCLIGLAAGCGGDGGDGDDETEGSTPQLNVGAQESVGQLEGGGLVAVALSGPAARVFVCDSATGTAEYFTGEIEDESFKLTSASGDATVDANVANNDVTGEVTLSEGGPTPFEAHPASTGSGLYELVKAGRRIDGLSSGNAKLTLRESSGDKVNGTATKPGEQELPVTGTLDGDARTGEYVGVVDLDAGAICAQGSSASVKNGEPNPNLRFSIRLSK